MKKIVAVAALFISAFGFCQKLDNALLWKISGNGLKEPSYLFGTMHIVCDATLEPNVLKALDATKQLYLEIDIEDAGIEAKIMDMALMKDGQKMSKLATPEDFEAVNKFLNENLGMPATLVDGFKPSIISMMVMGKTIDCPEDGMEKSLIEVTKQQNEPMFGLETVESQLALLDIVPYKEQMDELVKMAKEGPESSKESFKKLEALYKSKNLKAIADYMKAEDALENSEVMLDNRNLAWIPKIEQAAKATPTFFGVGAAHLIGEKGVIMLLRKKGYKVEAVK